MSLQDGAFVEDALDKHGDTVLRLACSMLNDTEAAHDMVQETFIKLLKSDVVFENDGHVLSWLITVTRNACCDVLRSQKRVTVELVDPTVPDALEKLMADRVQLSESAIAIDDGDYLWRHVAQLPLEQRTVVLLHYAEDLSIAEIADAMDKSRPCIRAQLSRARKSLRKMIDDERDQREEEEKHEMARKKKIQDLPKASSHAEARRRDKRPNSASHTRFGGGTRAKPGMRSHRQRTSISRPNDDEDGHPCAEVA